jgi:hypothetical protein
LWCTPCKNTIIKNFFLKNWKKVMLLKH